jgi:hypothetical protein
LLVRVLILSADNHKQRANEKSCEPDRYDKTSRGLNRGVSVIELAERAAYGLTSAGNLGTLDRRQCN